MILYSDANTINTAFVEGFSKLLKSDTRHNKELGRNFNVLSIWHDYNNACGISQSKYHTEKKSIDINKHTQENQENSESFSSTAP